MTDPSRDEYKKFVLENLPYCLQYWHARNCSCNLQQPKNDCTNCDELHPTVWPCRFNRKPRNYELYSLDLEAVKKFVANYKE